MGGESDRPSRRRDLSRWVYAASALFALVLMGRMADGFFFADDYNLLFIAKWINHPFKFFYTDHFEGVFFRPMGMAVLWIWNRLFGAHYWAYGLSIALFHLANGWLLGRIAVRLGCSGRAARIASSLFWVSPVAMGTSAWFSDLFYLQEAFLFMLAMERLYLLSLPNGEGPLAWVLLLLLTYALALTHDAGVAGTVGLGAAGLYWGAQQGRPAWSRFNRRLAGALLGVVILAFLHRYAVLGHLIHNVGVAEFSISQRLWSLFLFPVMSFSMRAEFFSSWGHTAIYALLGALAALAAASRMRNDPPTGALSRLAACLAIHFALALPSAAYGLDRLLEGQELSFWSVVGVRILYFPMPAACWALASLMDRQTEGDASLFDLRVGLAALLIALMGWTAWPMSDKILREMQEVSQPIYRGAEAAFEGVDFEDATTIVIGGLPEVHRHYVNTLIGSLPPNRGRWLVVSEEAQLHYSAYIYPYPDERLAPLRLADDGLRNPSGFDRILVYKTDRVPDRPTLCRYDHVRIFDARPNRPAWIFDDRTDSICPPHREELNHAP